MEKLESSADDVVAGRLGRVVADSELGNEERCSVERESRSKVLERVLDAYWVLGLLKPSERTQPPLLCKEDDPDSSGRLSVAATMLLRIVSVFLAFLSSDSDWMKSDEAGVT